MAKRWDESQIPGAITALALFGVALWPWFYWWPEADREGFDRFVMHMTRLIWPFAASLAGIGQLADAMLRHKFQKRDHMTGEVARRGKEPGERRDSLMHAIGLFVGAAVHYSQYRLNVWVLVGWCAGGTIGLVLPAVLPRPKGRYE